MKKYAIILAGGKGTRMNTILPKCAVKINGSSMIEKIVATCEKCNFDDIIVVVGYKGEVIREILKNKVSYVYQDKQLGTAHAVLCCEDYLKNKDNGICVIIPGDMPFIDEYVVQNLINSHIKTNYLFTIVSTKLENPSYYGRVVRTIEGYLVKIIELKDASIEEKQIKEINSGLYCINTNIMFKYLKQINKNKITNEYYLTDLVEIILEDNKVGTLYVDESFKLIGINDLETLEQYNK